MGWWDWCRWRATPSTSCSAPTSKTYGCFAGGWRSSRDFNVQKILGGVLLGRGSGFGLARTARQRERLAVIERADAVLVEAGFLNLQIGAIQRIRRQLFNRELDSFRGGAETAIRKASALLLADGGRKQF